MKKLIWICLLAAATTTLTGCDDEECLPAPEALNDVTDLIGFLDPNDTEAETGTVYAHPDYVPQVLAQFGAVPAGGDIYSTTVFTLEGDEVEFRFTVQETSTPFIFVTSDKPEEVLSKYKVYKDAQCKSGDDPKAPGECFPDGDEYYTLEFLGWDFCERGSGECTEIQKVVFIKRIYEDAVCKILTRVDTRKQYDC